MTNIIELELELTQKYYRSRQLILRKKKWAEKDCKVLEQLLL